MSISKCPTCGAKPGVIDSRSVLDGVTCRRRYACPNGHRFSTYEILMDPDEMTNQDTMDSKRATRERLGKVAAERILGGTFEKL